MTDRSEPSIENGLYTVFNETSKTDYSFEAVQWTDADGHHPSKVHLTHGGLTDRWGARGRGPSGYAMYLDFTQGTTMCGVLIPHEREVGTLTVMTQLCRTCDRLARS